ncbi:MAG TPA: cytochrome c-type biogenesis CcmF C-terminal domain-containing protein [Solirubrobacteraceae bacterium]|jgi:cytochrome c-type biogenesis protein CcmF|nr:cytochrome c-type biogenesis CcmF C-terminal domain-containing protein [Solirubrobacteraceae bacterium]
MASVGKALLILGFVVALYGLAASLYGAITGQRAWVDSGRRSMYAIAGLTTFAFAIIEAAFLRSDFSYTIVSSASSTTTPTLYKAAAVWSTQQGSLLLWVWLLSIWSSLALFLTRHRVREIVPYAAAVLFGFCSFFLALTMLFANPFGTAANPPAEGAGLDPLLRHTTMVIHPPMVYTGYTLLTIPFAFAVAALVTGRLKADWIQVTRRFALAAWLCLGVGVLLGARWSYTELGWGGYWAWDPVENAALMPWLLATAFLHSIMIQEKRGMLKVWNVSLILATGTMAIVGTFLVRSGILQSIHAFVSDPTLNIAFVTLIAVMVVSSVSLVVHRRAELRTESRLDSLLSREAVFLFQNLVLVALTAVIFWLTFFPLISEAVTGTQQSIGPPAFRPFVVPLALILVLLSGIGPIIAWRRVTVANLRRSFAFPVAVALITLALLLTVVSGVGSHTFALLMFCFAAFALASVAQEFWRGVRARRAMTHEPAPVALLSLVRRNRRRYGGYTVHAGLAVLLIGVAASQSFQHSRYATMRPGQSANIDGYNVRYVRPTASPAAEKISFGAVLDVSKNGHHVTTLRTSYGLYPSQDPSLGVVGRFFNSGSVESRIGLDAGFTHDIWTVVNVGNVTPLQGDISKGDRLFASLMSAVAKLPPSQQQSRLNTLFAYRDQLINELTQRFITHPWPVQFLLIVSPLVTWLWLGGIIVAFGGLIALWPIPVLARRRVRSAAYAARLTRELA